LANIIASEPPTELLSHCAVTIAVVPVVVRSVEYAGSASCFVQAPAAEISTVTKTLADAGALECMPAAIESARLEAGFPLFGQDITEDNLPQEVGRDAQAISFTKGCYLGQETVARIDALGHVNRRLVGLKFSGTEIPQIGAAIIAGDQQVGRVTSAAWSPL